jgi:hypothetical protein
VVGKRRVRSNDMSNQPIWKLVANLGDASPLEYGGKFLYVDTTGVYSPEVKVIIPPEERPGFPFNGAKADPECDEEPAKELIPDKVPQKYKTEVWRFTVEPCTYINGILSDNKFHPECGAWFAGTEAERLERPQDTTYLKGLAEYIGLTADELIALFLNENVEARASAWIAIGEYHGWEELDQYPLYLTAAECEERYREDLLVLKTLK